MTLREDEAWALRCLAATPEPIRDRMLRAVDAFCEPDASDLTVELRRHLLDRLGVFGVRFCVGEIRGQRSTSAGELAAALVAVSGLDAVRQLIVHRFLPRADILKARTALISLRTIAEALRSVDVIGGNRLAALIEHDQRDELDVLTSPSTDVHERLGLDRDAVPATLHAGALAGIERWRTLGAAPMADVAMREACETMAHTYEGIFVELHEPSGGHA